VSPAGVIALTEFPQLSDSAQIMTATAGAGCGA